MNIIGMPHKMISGNRVNLRPLKVVDVTQRYVDWLNDPEVNHFLSVKDIRQDIDMVQAYVRSYEGVKERLLLGVFDKTNEKHIGNITFSSIDRENGFGTVGIAIGDKAYWGKGYASEALKEVINYAFFSLKLKKIEAGVDVDNLASQKLFKNVGFITDHIVNDRQIMFRIEP
ncbi:MAG: GNAT family N-acetyltransferase [bacterium]